MKKRKEPGEGRKKLRLSRETLRALEGIDTRQVAGGAVVSMNDSCLTAKACNPCVDHTGSE